MKILLADDSELIIESLKSFFKTIKDIEIVATCKNGIEALESIKNIKPDVAIVDIKMPGLNGLQVLSEVRKDNSTIMFIMFTLNSTDYYRKVSLSKGADYFFSKSDDLEKIADVIRK